MTVGVAIVMSVDGKLTRHREAGMDGWASQQDQAQFRTLIAQHEVIVMGSHTYAAARGSIQLNQPIKRIVLSHSPEQFSDEAVADRLEFRNQSPSNLMKELRDKGVKSVLVVGGPQIITELLGHQLVDRFIITLEPRLFGEGIPLLKLVPIDIQLQLTACQQLNPAGTLRLDYTVKYS